jgi:hypothetical protein
MAYVTQKNNPSFLNQVLPKPLIDFGDTAKMPTLFQKFLGAEKH